VRVLAIAHRAGNSLAGLQAAAQLGVDVIECDVHEHRGRLEVRHLKTAGPLPFLWDRWELASASAPRLGLDEVIAAGQHGTRFMLDLKGRRSSTARSVAELLHGQGHLDQILVCGRYWPSVEVLAELPFVRPVLSARNRTELSRLQVRLRDQRQDNRVHGVSVHRSLLDAAVVAELQERVDVVMSWPINDIRSLDWALEVGVTGVISDEATVLEELVRRRPAGPDGAGGAGEAGGAGR
jgi:glycerophosphoryl diester phosphodiesterase